MGDLNAADLYRLMAWLSPTYPIGAFSYIATALDDAGGAAFRADLASMRHETQHTRLFRS